MRHRLDSTSLTNSPEMTSCHQVEPIALMRGKLIGGKIAVTAAISHRISSRAMNATPSQREFQSARDLARAFSAEVATTKGGSLGVRSGFIRMESNTDLSSPRRRG